MYVPMSHVYTQCRTRPGAGAQLNSQRGMTERLQRLGPTLVGNQLSEARVHLIVLGDPHVPGDSLKPLSASWAPQ